MLDTRPCNFVSYRILDGVEPGTGQVHLGLKHIQTYGLAVAIKNLSAGECLFIRGHGLSGSKHSLTGVFLVPPSGCQINFETVETRPFSLARLEILGRGLGHLSIGQPALKERELKKDSAQPFSFSAPKVMMAHPEVTLQADLREIGSPDGFDLGLTLLYF